MTSHSPLAIYQSYPPDVEEARKGPPPKTQPYRRSLTLPTSNPLSLRLIRDLEKYIKRTEPEPIDPKLQGFVDLLLDEHDKLYGVTERFRCRVCYLKAGKKKDKTCKCRRRVETEEENGISIGDVEGAQKGNGGEEKREEGQRAREGQTESTGLRVERN